ncbi:uncharacterized protein TRAVEDRAFT_42590 [Trametes versicolor FP-101664 SS1]|uniref:uncharacterized protein n=1 Tax=Trametes versicolor (strain FP-101664) TaxID=717944 RepID=UPI000462440E|nr:uncharacterized protein TRAVEDRAFT_42590 [Trametes versicolor FP-101664 SS1]EIW65212.1 hypothetical protein TRAVEDRAFT_42590 [Trametes versicolor FP-101664 SS1]
MPNTSSAPHTHTTHGHPSSVHALASTRPIATHAPATPVVTSAAAQAPRARGQNTRKRAVQADDAAYHAAAGTKRAAPERADGDRERTKRKRVDASGGSAGSQVNAGHSGNVGEKEDRVSLVSLLFFRPIFLACCVGRISDACLVERYETWDAS